MKYINIIIAVFSLVMFSGCEDFLNTDPISSISENSFYTNDAELEVAMVGVYDAYQEVPLREFALTEMRSDNSNTRLSEGDWAEFEALSVSSTNSTVYDYWSYNYFTIHRANTVLEYLDVIEDADLKVQLEGEAKFMRALCHFNLVRLFENIPYVEGIILAAESSTIEQDSESTVYAKIVADLQDAISLLPNRSDIAEGRATYGAAQALLGKVYLTTGDYSLAQTAFETVISTGDYSLMSSYYDIFYTEMNSETIFSVQYESDDSDNSQDFSYEFTVLGVAGGINIPTDNLIAEFVEADSVRFETCISADSSVVAKFLTSSSDETLCGNDWIVMRYADILLMYVEAVMAGGTSTTDVTAVGYFNDVRIRAGLIADVDSEITSDELLSERRLEFAFENSRWFDLKRFDVQANVLDAFAITEGFTYESTDLILPIPNYEITASDVYVQNDGY